MKLKVAFIIQSIVGLVFGLGFIFLPDQMMSAYVDHALGQDYLYLTRLYGSAALGFGTIALLGIWFTELKSKRSLAYGLGLFTSTHCILFIIGTAQGILTSMGWVQVVVTAILTTLYIIGLLTENNKPIPEGQTQS